MKRTNKAFTLVEMLIVVVIIGILAAALIPRLIGAQGAARDVARVKGVGDFQTALEIYNNDQGQYPIPGTSDDGKGGKVTFCTDSLRVVLSGQMSNVSKDPQANRTTYATKTDGCAGSFGYTTLKANGGDNAAYALASNLESPKSENYVAKAGTLIQTVDLKDVKDEINTCSKKVTVGTFTTADKCIGSDNEGNYVLNANM